MVFYRLLNLSGILKLWFCGISILLGSIGCSISMKVHSLWDHHMKMVVLWDPFSRFYQLVQFHEKIAAM